VGRRLGVDSRRMTVERFVLLVTAGLAAACASAGQPHPGAVSGDGPPSVADAAPTDAAMAAAPADGAVAHQDGVTVVAPADGAPVALSSPDPRFLPRPTGPCPDFAEGMITVHPHGVARDVQLWMSSSAHKGPLVFYWHGTNGQPAQAVQGLGQRTIDAIRQQGGIVAAPAHDPAAGTWPWYLVAGTQELDLDVADEVLACAIDKVGVDLRRIHSVGFSAGAIQTVQMSYRRAGYLASVVTYSGGQLADIPDQDPANRFAAMLFHGGPSDQVVVGFAMVTEQYRAALAAAGRFAFVCNHGMGHRIPVEAVDSVWRFLQDHPFGTTPSPYAAALPAGFPSYCTL